MHVFPERIRSQLRFKIFGFADDDPKSHGEFSDHPYWKPEFWKRPNPLASESSFPDGQLGDSPSLTRP